MKEETMKIASKQGQREQVPGLPSGSNLCKFIIQLSNSIRTAITTILFGDSVLC